MAVYSSSQILPEKEILFLLDLLPNSQPSAPDIYIFDDWNTISALNGMKSNLYSRYNLLKHLVKSSIFSTYNYEQKKIFIYLFNLPYKDPFLKKLHGAFCLFHEMRHHHQFTTNKHQFLFEHPQKSPFYSLSWAEKDANKFAVKWLRLNRIKINEQFQLHTHCWDIGVNEQNKLRILLN